MFFFLMLGVCLVVSFGVSLQYLFGVSHLGFYERKQLMCAFPQSPSSSLTLLRRQLVFEPSSALGEGTST